MTRILLFILPFVALCGALSASAPYHLYIQEESYHMRRQRDGGTKQKGWLNGGRVGADRIKPWGIYLGGEASYATGDIRGHSGRRSPLKSEITDTRYEGRIGFTFANSRPRFHTFTPFVGYGYFKEQNNLIPPSRFPFHFTETYNYVTTGFLSGTNFTSLLNVGLNFKIRFMQNGRSKVSNDPLFEDITLMMNNETNYRVDCPIRFAFCGPFSLMEMMIGPFLEWRHFGGREGFPFDFFDTKFRLVGFNLGLGVRF